MKCIICENKIKNEYLDGVKGKICAECLKRNHAYYVFKSLNLIKITIGE